MATMTMSATCAQPLAARKTFGSTAKLAATPKVRAAKRNVVTRAARDGPVIIGLAADSGCGKSTFMRRMTSLFGGKATPPEGGNPDSNTLISDTTTVLCLDDYHLNDRNGRKESGLTALNLKEQNFGASACHASPRPLSRVREGLDDALPAAFRSLTKRVKFLLERIFLGLIHRTRLRSRVRARSNRVDTPWKSSEETCSGVPSSRASSLGVQRRRGPRSRDRSWAVLLPRFFTLPQNVFRPVR